jgi:hypothetical protein
MQVFVRDHFPMIAAAVQGDVDGVAKGSHLGRVARVGSIGNGPLDRSKRGPGWDRDFPPKQSLDGAPKDRACDERPEQQILRPAYPTAWGPERAGSQDDTAKVIVDLRPPVTLRIVVPTQAEATPATKTCRWGPRCLRDGAPRFVVTEVSALTVPRNVRWTRSPQKTAPVFDGGQVALVLSCCESFFGGRTAGEPSARERASGGGFAVYAAPHLSGTTCHGETWSPGPPNCFPSTECVRCRL